MKKNLFKVLTALAFVLCATLTFAGCDLFGGSKEVLSIDLTQTFKTQYQLGENVDPTNGMIKITYDDDTQKDIAVTSSMISNFDNQTVGQRNMIITYKEATCTVSYTVTGIKPSENYLYSVPGSDFEQYIYLFNLSGAYYLKNYSPDTASSLANEWAKLQTTSYLQEICPSGTESNVSFQLKNDYYYYMTIDMGTTMEFKIVSMDCWIRTSDSYNMLEGLTRYIPTV